MEDWIGVEWIDVEEELPEEYEAYLVAFTTPKLKCHFVGICEYDTNYDEWCIKDMRQYEFYGDAIEIKYWSELPKPPKKEKKNDK